MKKMPSTWQGSINFLCLVIAATCHSANPPLAQESQDSSPAQTGVVQWVGHHSTELKVTGSIPSQGTYQGCRPGPQLGVCKRQPIDVSLAHWYFSSALSPSLPLSLK